MAKQRAAAFWQRHIDNWSRSGQTQSAYCSDHNLSLKSFSRWRSVVRKTAAIEPALTLVPVSVSAPVIGTMALRSPGGWTLELPACEATWLADLLRHLP